MEAKNGLWFRRVVPPGYAEATLNLEGATPLLMSSGEFDTYSPTYRSYYMLGQKKSKSLDDQQRLQELEWQLRIYLDEEIGPFIPGKNIHELLRSAATKFRKGEELKRSMVVEDYRIPLLYEGPRDAKALWEQGYRHTGLVANAGVNRGRVLRCRPMFPLWSLETKIAFDPEDLDFDLLEVVVERSQKYGLGDYRPIFGSFKATLTLDVLSKDGARGESVKKTKAVEKDAHTKRVNAIKA